MRYDPIPFWGYYAKKKEESFTKTLAIRWFHWINFPVLTYDLERLTNLLGKRHLQIGFGDTAQIKFFPQKFYDFLNIPQCHGEGMAWHFLWLSRIMNIM